MKARILVMYDNPLDMLAAAQRAKVKTFYADCALHGLTDHSVKRGDCLACRPVRAKHNIHRIAARANGARSYPGQCDTHGETPFDTIHGKCLQCYTTAGKRRRDPARDAPYERIQARRSGSNIYMGHCDLHGAVVHDTIRGKCLRCYTTLGYPRKPKAPAGPTTRQAARAAGAKHFMSDCAEHGHTRFGTGRGKCLRCYTVAGYPRTSGG